MPGGDRRTRWHFKLQAGGVRGITIVRSQKEVANKSGVPLGALVSIQTPSTRKSCALAQGFLDHAIQANFKCGSSIVLNKQHHEWNTCEFNRQLRMESQDLKAVDFLEKWEKFVKYNVVRGFLVPRTVLENLDETTSSPLESSQATDLSSGSQSMCTSQLDPEHEEDILPVLKVPKLKHHDPLDDSIFNKRLGTFDLLLNSLIEPDKTRRCVRPIDNAFVHELARKFEKDPSAPGVPPLAVLCSSVNEKESFDVKRKDGYTYEILGGQHSALARRVVAVKFPDNMIMQRVFSEVYVGLSDDESLRLASRHNTNGHFVHKMTHRDYVETCRSKLFSMESGAGETPEQSDEWKQTCKRCILPEDMGRCTMENIFHQAAFKCSVWALAVKVMDMFEEGELKDQHLSTKALITKPVFRQQYLSSIQCLPVKFKVEVLQQVVDGDISLSELKEKAATFRSTKDIQKAFCRITNTTWVEARRRFPDHTSESALQAFVTLVKPTKIPPAFTIFCEGALQAEMHATKDHSINIHTYGHNRAILVEKDIFIVSCNDIRSLNETYMGASLFVANIPKHWSVEEAKKMIYSCKQVNTIPEKTISAYNIALVGSLEQLPLLKESLEACYESVSVCYWHNEHPSTNGESKLGFTQAMGSVVIGHYSINGVLQKDHFNQEGNRTNFFKSTPNDLSGSSDQGEVPISVYKAIISTLSFEGQCIFDATSGNGNCAVASLKMKRDVVVVRSNVQNVKTELLKLSC